MNKCFSDWQSLSKRVMELSQLSKRVMALSKSYGTFTALKNSYGTFTALNKTYETFTALLLISWNGTVHVSTETGISTKHGWHEHQKPTTIECYSSKWLHSYIRLYMRVVSLDSWLVLLHWSYACITGRSQGLHVATWKDSLLYNVHV